MKIAGSIQYFGINPDCEGDVIADSGTPIIHGMLITDGSLSGNGTPDLRYNDKCVRGLNTQFPVGSRLVPGYWRELTPTM